MDKTKLMQRLMATFLEELEEHVRKLNQDLLALEKELSAEERATCLKEIFRTAHSLKGAARSVNVDPIESVCHRLEDILSAARDGRAPLDPERIALLFAVADGIEEAGMRLREQRDLSASPLTALLPQLDAAVKGLGSFGGTAAPVAPAPAAREPSPPAPALSAPPPPSPTPTPASPPIPAIVPSRPPASELHPDSSGTAASVRVSAEKLDSFLARTGELLIARRRVEGRVADVVALRDLAVAWHTAWRPVEKLLAQLLPEEENGTGRALTPRQEAALTRLRARRPSQVLRGMGESLRRLEKDLDHLSMTMTRDARLLKQAAVPLDDEVHHVRMLPFAEACQGLDRAVHDLARAGGKEVELVVEGGAVELDRSVLEGLKDPLRHLVRNAVDHGLEEPMGRRQAGKSQQGRVVIAAALRGGQVEVTVQDDGRGLDLNALRERARERRLPEPADERELGRLIFLPGLSTSRIITDVSGRGVGMDVVKSRVEALHGTIDFSSEPGKGVRFTLTVPLTLTTLRAVLVGVAGQSVALAGTNVQRLVRVRPTDLCSVAGRPMLSLGGALLPLASLAAVLGLGPGVLPRFPTEAGDDRESGNSRKQSSSAALPVLVVAGAEKRMAFAVDELIAEQEIVVKSLGSRIRHLPLVAGATILPSGRVALVLNAAGLVRAGLRQTPSQATAQAEEPSRRARKRLLVVDDSVTTRTLEKSILEAAGYEVTTAVDGQAAWHILHEQGADLVVSDVEMPQMDGFALTEAIRASKRFQSLPVVLVTARESEQDKARGIEVGADAYLVKSAFDQKNLLETIAQLL
jgi:two-component system chemotaxis sensor kinase CheA